MTGPEHYREAEELLDRAEGEAHVIAAAQVHATLALVAATAEAAGSDPFADTAPEWRAALR